MIRIQNIYYMLAYAFKVLNEQGYREIGAEDFENSTELLAAILCRGIKVQLKRGLGREYIRHAEPLSSLRGKINVTESVKTQSMLKKQMVCEYDEFSVNSYLNRIIKTTAVLLLRSDISKNRKKELKKLMLYFSDVDILDVYSIDWNIRFNRNNQTYMMLVAICQMIVRSMLQTTKNGSRRMVDFLDEQSMHRLYEKFILEYYKKEHPELNVNASKIDWAVDDGIRTMLPNMQSDIMLSDNKDRVLIIDAKYYTRTTQVQYDVHSLHSNNMYQIFTYVKNKQAEYPEMNGNVSGMLLYAMTDEKIQPDNTYQMSGNAISVKTLDLNVDFSSIREQLDNITRIYFDN